MERLERTAELSILRALGFVGLGVGLLMVGLSFDPGLAFLVGGIVTMLTAAILAYRGLGALRRNPHITHAWIMLAGDYGGLSKERVEAQLGPILQRLYYRFAIRAGAIGAVFWLLSLLFRL